MRLDVNRLSVEVVLSVVAFKEGGSHEVVPGVTRNEGKATRGGIIRNRIEVVRWRDGVPVAID